MATWPNLQPSREQMHKVLRLLNSPTKDSLREARQMCAYLAESIPQLEPAQHCAEYRRNRPDQTVCLDRSCGHCGPIRSWNR
ncbi:hypothetical protein ACWDO7_22755 [Streptomyces sp. NPDC003656]|uniref:hypothetical protein n=1 Tax=Streptomyces sp. NPDC091385 TaxID=3365997 RepID=UPI00380B01CF